MAHYLCYQTFCHLRFYQKYGFMNFAEEVGKINEFLIILKMRENMRIMLEIFNKIAEKPLIELKERRKF